MKKLFVSQPMNGKSDAEILAERNKIIEKASFLIDEPFQVIDSFFTDVSPDAKPLWYLAKSLECLSTADVAVFGNGWEDARGCRIENLCAREYGIDTIEISAKP